MALRPLFQLLGFFDSAAKYATFDRQSIAEAEVVRSASIHRRIVLAGACFGLIGAGLGIAMLAVFGGKALEKEGAKVLLAPLMFAAEGTVLGAATAILFAPRWFLTGPAGQKWMKLVGTQSVLSVRIVCSIFLLLLVAIVVVMSWAAWSDMQRGLL
jgi:hypothetical protein